MMMLMIIIIILLYTMVFRIFLTYKEGGVCRWGSGVVGCLFRIVLAVNVSDKFLIHFFEIP